MTWWKLDLEKKADKSTRTDTARMHKLVEQNFHLHAKTIPGQTNGMHVIETGALVTVDSGLDCDSFNIVHIKNSKRITRDSLKDITNYFRLHGRPFTIWISDRQFISGLENVFNELSLQRSNTEPGMVTDLLSYQPLTNNQQHNIVIADTTKHFNDFSVVLAGLWSPADKNIVTYYQQTATQFLDPQNNIRLLIYYYDGIPVSTIEMFPTDRSTIGLYNLATLTKHRGKGIGSAMMNYALNTAKALGYKTAVLQASKDGIGIYKKFGFEVVTNYFEYQ